MNDVRYALRRLRRSPGFTATAVLTLGLGLGATAAIFAVVHAVLLRPLPFPHPDRLVMVWMHNPRQNIERDVSSYPNFLDWRRLNTTFEHLVGVAEGSANLTGDGDPEVIRRVRVSAGFFPMLGVAPSLGRALLPDDNVPGNHQVVVLSDGLWRRRYGADPAIVGRTIMLNGESFTVVGVAARNSTFPASADLWVPLSPTGDLAGLDELRTAYWLPLVGRLRAGVTREQAQADMSNVARGLEEQYPGNRGIGVLLEPLHASLVRDVRPALLLVFGAVGFVLLIVSANMANLLLARGTARTHELGVRAALGAGRRHVLRHALAESLALGLAGSFAGVLLAYWTVGVVKGVAPPDLEWLGDVRMSPTVLGFTFAIALATSLACGVPSAIRASRGDPRQGLGGTTRGGTPGRTTGRLQRSLVAAQFGLAVVLLAGAGLMIRSFVRLSAVDPGFEVARTLTFRVSLPGQRYRDPAAVRAFYTAFLTELRAVPGVESADAITDLLLGRLPGSSSISLDDESARSEAERQLPIPYDFVTPGFFETLGIPLRHGRHFESSDDAEAPRVAIVNEMFASRFFHGRDPLGQRFTFGNPEATDAQWYEVVGVVANTRRSGLDQEDRPLIYLPVSQASPGRMTVVVRAAGDPLRLVPLVRRALGTVDPDLPLSGIRSASQVLAESIAPRRFLVLLLGSFAGLAVVVAAVGVYGVMAYVVGQRTREIGVRLALGARPQEVLRQVVRDGLVVVGAGLVVGALGAFMLSRLIRGLLFDVSPTDPVTYAAVLLALVSVAAVACYVPARRAARIDPTEALRHE